MAPKIRTAWVGLVLLCTTILTAQERHFSQTDLASLYKSSAFAHGYIHGYEDGFHWGDVDLQLGRTPRDPAIIPDFKHASDGFEHTFGSKHMWEHGFRSGFQSGYEDAMHLRSFSAITRLRQAARGVPQTDKHSPVFDTAFFDGYGSGRKQGGNDAGDAASENPIVPPCMQLAGEYCDAFERGFYFGYADGFAHPSDQSRTLQAAAGQ